MRRINDILGGMGFFALGAMMLKNGFRGVKWGSHIKDLTGFEYWSKEKGINYYTREDDASEIGGIKISALLYGFRREKLVCVKIITGGEKNFKLLEKALSGKFGEAAVLPGESETGQKLAWMKDFIAVLLEKELVLTLVGGGTAASSVITLKIFNLDTVFEPAWEGYRACSGVKTAC